MVPAEGLDLRSRRAIVHAAWVAFPFVSCGSSRNHIRHIFSCPSPSNLHLTPG